MTWFTIADFNKGYWMVELHPDSRKLTTMALDIGHFPVDKTSNGFHHCTGCVPVKTWCYFPKCARCHWYSQWHDHLWKNRSWTWWKSPELFGSLQKEQSWHWIQIKCSSDFQKFPSLDTLGVIRDYQLTQRDWSCEKNGTSTGCGNHEKFPQIDQLSQPV